jgi:ComF family protein
VNKNFYFDQAISVCKYSGIVKKCIHWFKYKHKIKTSIAFSEILIRFLNHNYADNCFDIVTAVPLHKKKYLLRGFNQSQVIAEKISNALKIERSFDSLMRIKPTTPQSKLNSYQRAENIRDVFRCSRPGVFRKKRVLIIDDIYTTGSTLNECARIIKQDGAMNVTCLTIAR